jgi:hypothetical protein
MFDAIQVKRLYNHIALTCSARGGSDLKIRLDNEEKMDLETLKAELEGKITDLQSRCDALEGERDNLKEQVSQLTSDLEKANDPARLDSQVKSRLSLEREASPFLPGEDLVGLSDREIMEKVIRLDSKIDLEQKSDDYVAGAYKARVTAAIRLDAVDALRVSTASPSVAKKSRLEEAQNKLKAYRQDQLSGKTLRR